MDRLTPLAGDYEMNETGSSQSSRDARDVRIGAHGVVNRGRRAESSLQELVQESVDATGQLDVNQIATLVDHESKMQSEYSRMRHVILAIGIMIMAFGVVSAIVAKQMIDGMQTTKAEENGTLLTADGELVVATASATRKAELSSFLSDAALRELKVLSLTGDNEASIYMNILGFVRLPKQPCRHSVVKLFTAAGVLLLDGEKLTFDDGVSDVIAEAGFTTMLNMANQDGDAGRRLLSSGLSSMIGMFNFVGKFTDDGMFRADVHDECEDNLPSFQGVPEKFKLSATGYIQCLMPQMTPTEQDAWCRMKPNSAVPHPDKNIDGLYFTQSLTIAHDRVSRRSAITRSSSWDPLHRVEHQIEDEETSMLKSAQADVDDLLHNCNIAQLPTDGSLFDNASAETAKVIDVDGERVYSVKVNTYMSGLRLKNGQLAVDLELRIWMDVKTGAWRRFQVYDAVNVHYGTINTVDTRTPLTWSSQTFFDVDMMEAVDKFEEHTFNLDFTGQNADCDRVDHELAPLDRYPSHQSSNQYLAWRANAMDNPHHNERVVDYQKNNFKLDETDDDDDAVDSPTNRRLLEQQQQQQQQHVDHTQLRHALSSYSDDAAVVDELASGVQDQIDAAVQRALLAYETGVEQQMPTLPARRRRGRTAAAAAATSAAITTSATEVAPASRALLGNRPGSQCFNADWFAARLKFNSCFHSKDDIDLSLKWKVVGPNIPVAGVSIAATVDLVYKKEAASSKVTGGGCVQLTVGADALPSLVRKTCDKLGMQCTFNLAKICLRYDSVSNAITGMAVVGPARLQVTFKVFVPVTKNAVNNVHGWVHGDLMVWSFDRDIVSYDF